MTEFGTPPQGLTATGLCKSYGKRPILRGIDLAVAPGEIVGLMGPNGAGKTTCFYMLVGLIKADAGRISLNGHDIGDWPIYRRAQLGLGYLPQEPSIFRGLSVADTLRAVVEVVEGDHAVREDMLLQLLDEFGIAHLINAPAVALSGGERRRLEIARCMACRPSIVLLDEPFAGIDPIALADLRLLIQHLKTRGVGVIITDHNVREALEIVDRAYIINDGLVLRQGTPAEIVDDEQVRQVYLGEKFAL
jgi:lipopolysaccharide export system ATP-binding protein